VQGLRCLCNVAELGDNQPLIWACEPARAIIIEAAQASQPQEIKEHGLEALCCMTICGADLIEIWNDDRCRIAILEAATQTEHAENKEKGYWALANLTWCPELWTPMWEDVMTRATIEAGCPQDVPKSIRNNAISAYKRIEERSIGAAVDLPLDRSY
jgi:hypothetical protein